MKILGFERSTGAANHYRIVQPLYKLRQHGLADILTLHSQNATDLEFVTEKILESDIIIFQRPQDDRWFDFIKIAQKHGKIIVADYDDHPFLVSPLNPAYKHYGTTEVIYKWPDGKTNMLWVNGENGFNIEENITRQDYFKAAFKRADMVSTTTPILQKVFLTLNKNSVVLPNLIDFDMYPQVECVKKEIRIGWQGGFSHYEDLFMVASAIKKIIFKYDNVKFVFFGEAGFKGLFKEVPADRIEWHPWTQYVAYAYKLATLNLDIGLCPLIDNEFNKHKSAIKYFEYSVMGIPTIASDMPPYSPVMTSESALMVNPDGWYDAMERLISDMELRDRIAKSAYDNVYENYNIDTKIHLWADMYNKALNRDVSEIVEA